MKNFILTFLLLSFFTSSDILACDAPTYSEIGATNVSNTTATLNYYGNALYADYQYRQAGTNDPWIGENYTNWGSVDIDDLTPSTTYEFQVLEWCGSEWSNWSCKRYFCTLTVGPTPPSCTTPLNSYAYYTSCNSGVFIWSPVSGASSYEIKIFEWNGSGFESTTESAPGNHYYINQTLNNGSTYFFSISAICGSTDSGSTPFVTLDSYSCKISNEAEIDKNAFKPANSLSPPITDNGDLILPQSNTDLLIDLPKSKIINLSIYPNPATNNAVIECEIEETATVQLDLYDIKGRKIMSIVSDKKDAQTYTERLDLSMLDNGIYLIVGKVGEKLIQEKLVINK